MQIMQHHMLMTSYEYVGVGYDIADRGLVQTFPDQIV